ncbi:STAS domain-containing protein [Aliiroseovarius crassostreae]|uniref:STAS domain-containing protein n=1 Tax=Aliiroseovarius crassostreae TaxID=154981 RepID=UPI0021FB1D4A|nr:STAS domain-containing protein [Aliiroseovarius crassostreae]UWQ05790.1 STAS domain-containing protein [Aliiroseovarius crassostreae]
MSDTTLLLAPKLDLRAAAPLKDAILELRGQDLTLDAVGVTHLGTLGLQVIRAAAKTWAADGKSLDLINASNECEDQMTLLGFSSKTICQWEAV